MEFAGGKILGEVDDAVGIITFNNPEKRNAMSSEMWQGLMQLLDVFVADAALRVVVITGAGTRAFVAGGQIEPPSREQPADVVSRRGLIEAAVEKLGGFPKPVLAAINGYCIGAGVAIALEADLRFASEDARFAVPVAKLGITYPLDAVRRLISIVGPANALMLLYGGNQISAVEAERIGLVQRVAPGDRLLAETLDFARSLGENAPLSLAALKLSKRHIVDGIGRREEVEQVIAACLTSADGREGKAAFLEKRKPVFRGA